MQETPFLRLRGTISLFLCSACQKNPSKNQENNLVSDRHEKALSSCNPPNNRTVLKFPSSQCLTPNKATQQLDHSLLMSYFHTIPVSVLQTFLEALFFPKLKGVTLIYNSENLARIQKNVKPPVCNNLFSQET